MTTSNEELISEVYDAVTEFFDGITTAEEAQTKIGNCFDRVREESLKEAAITHTRIIEVIKQHLTPTQKVEIERSVNSLFIDIARSLYTSIAPNDNQTSS